MARREFKFDFSKYTYVIDEEKHDFLVYRYDEDITKRVMNNPLLDLIIAYNALYEKQNKIKINKKKQLLLCSCFFFISIHLQRTDSGSFSLLSQELLLRQDLSRLL